VVDATGSERQTVHLFRSLDVKNKGWINPSELKDGLNSLGSNLNDIEFSLLLSKIDKNSDGKIELKVLTFCKFFSQPFSQRYMYSRKNSHSTHAHTYTYAYI